MLSLFTLNLWRYYDFEKRLPNIISSLQKYQPDIIFFQETQIDPSHSPFSQIEQIKKQILSHQFSFQSTIYLKKSQRGKTLETPVHHGMAVLSKYPIINGFEYYVAPNQNENEPRSILCLDIEKDNQILKLANIHLANQEDWAKKQLREFLNYIHSRNEQRIMAGDFNLYNLKNYQKLLQGYEISNIFKPYISYPKDNWCLDYILIPNTYSFQTLEIDNTYLSDHKGIFTIIKTN